MVTATQKRKTVIYTHAYQPNVIQILYKLRMRLFFIVFGKKCNLFHLKIATKIKTDRQITKNTLHKHLFRV